MTIPPTRRLPEHPDLAQLRRQAKELRKAYLSGDPEAAATVGAHFRDPDSADFALHRAQLVLARAYGFESWPKLKAHVDGVNVAGLAEAVRVGDVDRARVILEVRPELVNMEMAEDNSHRALHYAVLERSRDMVRLLMTHGADARQGIYPLRDATSPLIIATERGYDEIVAIIREEEARREAVAVELETVSNQAAEPDPLSSEPLADAVRRDDPEALAQLLGQGLNPDEPTRLEDLEDPVYSSGGPLWHCAIAGKHALAQMLLEHGANPNAQVYAGGSAVFQAYGQRDKQMVDLLERHGGVADAATLAHYRITDRAVRLLAETDTGALPDGVQSAAELVEEMLWGAACGGDPEIVRESLARTDWPPEDGRWYRILEQPLRIWNHLPSFWANDEFDRTTYLTCFELVVARCDPNVRGRFGLTILHDLAGARAHVTDTEQVAFATCLLDAGARLHLRDDLLRSTPLGWACRWGRMEFVKLLLERGADAAEPDARPWATPRAWAEKRGHKKVLEILEASV